MNDLRGGDAVSYIKNLRENQPIFDEFVPTFEKGKEPWNQLASHILTPSEDNNKKFMKYINRYSEYRDNLECNDKLVQMTLTKKGKNLLNDRVVHFPFTYTKIKSS